MAKKSNKLYVIIQEIAYEGENLYGVYDTEELAQIDLDKYLKKHTVTCIEDWVIRPVKKNKFLPGYIED